jgi:hypothetical protein
VSAREQSALCGTCGSAPGEPCREIRTVIGKSIYLGHLRPSERPIVGTHLARLHRVLVRESIRKAARLEMRT